MHTLQDKLNKLDFVENKLTSFETNAGTNLPHVGKSILNRKNKSGGLTI